MNKFFIFLLASLFFHLTLISVITNLDSLIPNNSSYYRRIVDITQRKLPSKIEVISSSRLKEVKEKIKDLEKIRTVGKEDGRENIFTVPSSKKIPPTNGVRPKPPAIVVKGSAIKTSPKRPSTKQANQQLSHSSDKKLDPNSLDKSSSKNLDISKLKFKLSDSKKSLYHSNSNSLLKNIKQQALAEKNISNLGPQNLFPDTSTINLKKALNIEYNPTLFESSNVPTLPQNLNLNMKLESPKGVDLDKLNSLELKLYSFNLRVFKSYISAIYRSYEEYKLQNPHVDFDQVPSQSMLASVTYNVKGNIERIRFLRNSPDDRLQNLFQRALERNNVQNPPKEIVSNGEFNLRYELLINP